MIKLSGQAASAGYRLHGCNVITGSGYNFRRAVENGGISVEDHLNFTISLALKAGSMGIPFMPSNTALGSDPGRVLFPGFMVSAVVHAPFGGHPSPVPGFYNRDHDFFLEYREETKTVDVYRHWLEKWVYSVKDRGGSG